MVPVGVVAVRGVGAARHPRRGRMYAVGLTVLLGSGARRETTVDATVDDHDHRAPAPTTTTLDLSALPSCWPDPSFGQPSAVPVPADLAAALDAFAVDARDRAERRVGLGVDRRARRGVDPRSQPGARAGVEPEAAHRDGRAGGPRARRAPGDRGDARTFGRPRDRARGRSHTRVGRPALARPARRPGAGTRCHPGRGRAARRRDAPRRRPSRLRLAGLADPDLHRAAVGTDGRPQSRARATRLSSPTPRSRTPTASALPSPRRA